MGADKYNIYASIKMTTLFALEKLSKYFPVVDFCSN